jgi:murein DD-endopeptidase MepM/ murein hydrolase activator NlpD
MINGKGLFVEDLMTATDDVEELVDLAQALGLGHMLLKISDGEDALSDEVNDRTLKTMGALIDAGIDPIGYALVYGQKADLEAQAKRVIERLKHFQMGVGVVRTFDYPGQKWSGRGASTFVKALDAAKEAEDLIQLTLALSTYGDMALHPDFPYKEMMAGFQYAMPHVHWAESNGGNALQKLQQAYDQYFTRFPNDGFIPTGSVYSEELKVAGETFQWEPTARQVTMFMNQADAMDYSGVNFWSFESARANTSLWNAIRRFPFDEDLVLASELDDMGGGGTGSTMVSDLNVDDDGTATVYVNSDGYQQGVYETDTDGLTTFLRNGMTYAWTPRQDKTSTAYAQWLPKITETGEYSIEAHIPGTNATTQKARYHIHGVVGEDATVVIELNQLNYSDQWVRLGIFELDANHPYSGMVSLNNLTVGTDKDNAKVAFHPLRWRKVVRVEGIPEGYADGFDSPVGTEEERRTDKIWPGDWIDANPFLNLYSLGYHTGADHNLNSPRFDSDKGAPAYAIADGVVTYSGKAYNRDGSPSGFGTLVVIKHAPYVTDTGETIVAFSRYAHMKDLVVNDGDRVRRGDRVGTIWNIGTGAHHLHFDISTTSILESHPGHWPGSRKKDVEKHYVDPAEFIRMHRPKL